MKKRVLFAILFLFLITIFLIKHTEDRIVRMLVAPVSAKGDVLGINLWLPQVSDQAWPGAPEITAAAAFFIDTGTGQVLYAKNIHQRLPIASLVKTMTVLVALEHKRMDDVYTVSDQAAQVVPDKMFLIAGEKLTLKELLDGIFLVSGNDAAETIAEGTTGNRADFITLMNKKALQLDMKDTFYVNPSGLDEDTTNSFSSAYDLAVLTRYLIKTYPDVVDISSAEHIDLPKNETHQEYNMYSDISLLTTYPGVVGFKIGYTPEAGLTMITLARKNGHEVVGVVLNSEDRRNETRALLDYSFGKLERLSAKPQ